MTGPRMKRAARQLERVGHHPLVNARISERRLDPRDGVEIPFSESLTVAPLRWSCIDS